MRVQGDRADNVIVGKSMQCFSRVAIPDFASRQLTQDPMDDKAHAVKSALPVTARDVSSEILDDQTAPLWPRISFTLPAPFATDSPINVPIQSPSQLRSIGLPSLQADIRRYVPSSRLRLARSEVWGSRQLGATYRLENCKWVTGRVCPEQSSG